jgi:hypothetical protein
VEGDREETMKMTLVTIMLNSPGGIEAIVLDPQDIVDIIWPPLGTTDETLLRVQKEIKAKGLKLETADGQ